MVDMSIDQALAVLNLLVGLACLQLELKRR